MSDSFVELPQALLPMDQQEIEMTIKTDASDGILFWQGQVPSESGVGKDFLALALVDGYVQFR